nr:hypothetical protein [Pseudodesulfovibrio sp.]
MIFIIFLIVIVIWIGLGIIAYDIQPEVERAGQFGDMFGFSNSLFSGLALAGLLITIWFQREEIQIQREELQLTREEMREQTQQFANQKEEMAAQADFLRKQANILRRQRVQDSFFSMLKLHTDMTSSLQMNIGSPSVKGVKCIKHFVGVCENSVLNISEEEIEKRTAAFAEQINQYLKNYDVDFESYLFRIESLLELIDSSGLKDIEYLVNALRGCMYEYEEQFVWYTLQYSPASFVKLRILFKKYQLDISAHELQMRRFIDVVNS